MTRRQRNIIILLGILVIILILLILLLMRFWPKPKPEQVIEEEPVVLEEVEETDSRTPIQKKQAEERETTASVQTVAKTFVERYGSYSNESDFANLRDLYPLMTDAFKAETEAYIEGTTIPETFYGITTRVITLKIDDYDETAGTATVTISTQREEAVDSPQNVSVRYQDIELSLVMESGVWKVDSAQWK